MEMVVKGQEGKPTQYRTVLGQTQMKTVKVGRSAQISDRI